MATASLRNQLLQLALPLIKTHGFTRETLSRSALYLPSTPHVEPLHDTAVSALFGEGDDARRTLITAWLKGGRTQMRNSPSTAMRDVLSTRLRYNEPVLSLLPEAFAVLASPSGLHIVDPVPGLKHAADVADEACVISGDATTGTMWYARRGSVAAIYGVAELHQLASPETAYDFLDGLLDTSSKVKQSLDEVSLFASYVGKSWAGIIRSRDLF